MAVLFLLILARLCTQEVSVEAETALRALAAKDPSDADLTYRLGLVLVKQKKLDEAARALETATRTAPDYTLKCYVPAAGGTSSDMSPSA